MAEGYTHTAGGGYTLNIIRHGHDQVVQKIGHNGTGGEVKPGEALQIGEDGNGEVEFTHHDGSADNGVYIAIEADGRGMTAQPDDGDGYGDGEAITAVRFTDAAGLNVRLATGETVAIGDAVGPAAGTGNFTTGSSNLVAEADEALDTTGASSPELVQTEGI